MLQLRAGIQADKYQDRSRWHWPKCQPLPEYTKPTTVPAVWFRNCRVSQKLRPFLSLLSGCVTVSPAGIPPWLRPRQWSNLWGFFPAFFGRITELKSHVPHRPFRNVAFGTGTAESQPSHAASHFCNGRKACGAQTADLHSLRRYLQVGYYSNIQVTQCRPEAKAHALKPRRVIWMQWQHKKEPLQPCKGLYFDTKKTNGRQTCLSRLWAFVCH